MKAILVGAAAMALTVAATASARAQDPAYVGTWAVNAAQCPVGQDQEDAPMIVKRNGYDQHETHCTFTSVRKRGAAWTAKARCQVEGGKQNINFTLAVADNQLTVGDKTGPRTLQRCS